MPTFVEILDTGLVVHKVHKSHRIMWICSPMFTFDRQWREIKIKQYGDLRKRDSHCFFCGSQFKDGEIMGLVCLKGRTNELSCESCVGELSDKSGIKPSARKTLTDQE